MLLNAVPGLRKFYNRLLAIPDTSIEKNALLILVTWSFSPIAAALFSTLSYENGQVNQIMQFYYLICGWYAILLITGFTGCLLGFIAFIKGSHKEATDNIGTKKYLAARLFPLLLFIMLFWSLLSYLSAPYPSLHIYGTPFKRDGILTYFASFGIFCCGYIISNKRLINVIIKFFTWIAVVQSVLSLLNIDVLNKILALTPASGMYVNINHFGYYACMAVMASLYLFEAEKKSLITKVIRMAVFVIISAALIFNNSIGPILATLAAMITSLILAIWLDKRRIKYALAGIIIFILLAVGINSFNGRLFSDLGILGFDFANVVAGEAEDGAGSGRWILWKNSIQIIKSWPILGCGPATYSDLSTYLFNESMRPHNEILEYAATIGIPGLLFYLSAIFVLIKEFLKKRKLVTPLVVGLCCVLIAYFVSSLFGVVMYYTAPFYFMFLGMAGKMVRKVTPEGVGVQDSTLKEQQTDLDKDIRD